MIKAVIFDLDNTLLDFIKMKREAVMNALLSMKEAGLEIDSYEKSLKSIKVGILLRTKQVLSMIEMTQLINSIILQYHIK